MRHQGSLGRQLVRQIDEVTGWLDEAVQVVLIVVMAAIFVLMMTQVLLRYVIHSPIIWIEEAAAYLLPLLALWGTAVCLRHGSHIKVDFFLDAMPRRLRQIVSIGISLLIFYFALKLVQAGLVLMELGRNELATSQAFSLYWPRLSIVIGGVLIMVQAANQILRELVSPGPDPESGRISRSSTDAAR